MRRLAWCLLVLVGCEESDGFGDRVSRDEVGAGGACDIGGNSDILAATGSLDGAVHWDCLPDEEAEGSPRFSGFAGLTTGVNGGSLRLQLFPDNVGDFAERDVYVGIDGRRTLFVTRLTPGEDGRATFDLQLQPGAPEGAQTLLVAINDDGTPDAQATGEWLRIPINIIRVADGGADIQVSVSWQNRTGVGAYTDVDLHVIDPGGDRVYFANPVGLSGGTLDLDSNAACSVGDYTENIYWPIGSGVPGSYQVELHYWSACGYAAEVDYLVTILRDGSLLRTVEGTLLPEQAGGDMVPISTFDY